MNRTLSSILLGLLLSNVAAAQPASIDFTLTGLAWPGNSPKIPFHVSHSLIGRVPYDAPFPAALSAILDAARTWNEQGASSAELRYEGLTTVSEVKDDGINTILYEDGPCPYAPDGLMATFLHRRGTLVHGFDVVLYRGGLLRHRNFWTARAQLYPWESDLCGVMTHEFGHVLGLGHSDGPGTVMSSPCHRATLRARQLTAADVHGLQILYGTRSGTGLVVHPANPRPGEVVEFTIDRPRAAGRPFLLLATGRPTEIPLRRIEPRDSRILPLDLDYFPVVDDFGSMPHGYGILDAFGRGRCRIHVPADPRYEGMSIRVTLLTFDSHILSGILDLGPTVWMRIATTPRSLEAKVREDREGDR